MRLPSSPLPLAPGDGRLTTREWLALVLGALAVAVLVCLVEPTIFESTDWVRMHSLYKAYIQSSVGQGRLPLWNPHHWLGRPFLADMETAFFYPPEALYLFLDMHLALLFTCALHFLLLGYGAVKLSRALGAARWASFGVAAVMAGSAPIVGCFGSGLVHYGQALCYLPLVLYLGVRLQAAPGARAVALLGLVLGLQILCGHPQAAWLTEVALAVFLVGRRLGRPWGASFGRLAGELGLAGAALALGLALAAVALLPMAELAAYGNRGAPSVAFSGLFAEPLFGWATLVVPTQVPYFRLQANAQLYAGVLPLLAGVCGLLMLRDRNLRALSVLAVFAALLAVGEQTPLFRLLFHVLPGLPWFRIPSRATVLVTLTIVLAAGVFVSRPCERVVLWRIALLGGLAATASVLFCLLWPGYHDVSIASAAVRGTAALVAAGLLGCGLGAKNGRGRRLVGGLAILFVVADVAHAARALKQDNRAVAPVELERRLQELLAQAGLLAPGQPPPRVFVPGVRENAGMVRGWSTPYGYSALAPGRAWRFMHESLALTPPVAVNTFPSPTLAAFGPFPNRAMALVAGVDPVTGYLARSGQPDPRAFVATAVRRVRDDGEAIRLMREGHDFHAVALVEQAPSLPSEPATGKASATIEHFAPEQITVAVESPQPGLLVLAEPWFPGWSAVVNGAPAPCLPANAWMRAVPVSAGKSHVVFSFRSTHLALGAVVSLAALVVVVLLLLVSGRKAGNLLAPRRQ
jgi:hypothetical protein